MKFVKINVRFSGKTVFEKKLIYRINRERESGGNALVVLKSN